MFRCQHTVFCDNAAPLTTSTKGNPRSVLSCVQVYQPLHWHNWMTACNSCSVINSIVICYPRRTRKSKGLSREHCDVFRLLFSVEHHLLFAVLLVKRLESGYSNRFSIRAHSLYLLLLQKRLSLKCEYLFIGRCPMQKVIFRIVPILAFIRCFSLHILRMLYRIIIVTITAFRLVIRSILRRSFSISVISISALIIASQFLFLFNEIVSARINGQCNRRCPVIVPIPFPPHQSRHSKYLIDQFRSRACSKCN